MTPGREKGTYRRAPSQLVVALPVVSGCRPSSSGIEIALHRLLDEEALAIRWRLLESLFSRKLAACAVSIPGITSTRRDAQSW